VPRILIDAGPLVALADGGDAAHLACQRVTRQLRDDLVTVWPAVTEAMYLLGKIPNGTERLWDVLADGRIELSPLDLGDLPRMRELMRKYRDLPMDLADAALVRVAERERIRRVFTLDRRDFELYRPSRLGRFEILP
jgi:predicted nucleic acid-binding protein